MRFSSWKRIFEAPIKANDEVHCEDFLICRGNGNLHLVGRGRFPTASMPGIAFPDTIIAARPDTALVSRQLLNAIWDTSHLRTQIERAARTTSGTHKINQRAVNSMEFPLPPRDLQHTFASRVSDIQAMIAQQERMAAASERLVQSLMAEVFNSKPPVQEMV